MGLIATIRFYKSKSPEVRDWFYVIPPELRDAYTQEMVDHLKDVPMIDPDTGDSRPAPTYEEVEESITEGLMQLMGVPIYYSPFSEPKHSTEPFVMSIFNEINRIKEHNRTTSLQYQIESYTIPHTRFTRYYQELGDWFIRNNPAATVNGLLQKLLAGEIVIDSIQVKVEQSTVEMLQTQRAVTLTTLPKSIQALQAMVDANARYVELTGRPQEAIAIHPKHARELLDILLSGHSIKSIDTPTA